LPGLSGPSLEESAEAEQGISHQLYTQHRTTRWKTLYIREQRADFSQHKDRNHNMTVRVGVNIMAFLV